MIIASNFNGSVPIHSGCRLILFLFTIFLIAASTAFPQTNSIQATVTTATGDLGGKIFGHAPNPARTRHYYIAAESHPWDFAPQGRDVVCGKPLPVPTLLHHTTIKSRYVAYSDATFTQPTEENPSLGILGPVMRGVVGDYLAITFLNRTDVPLSMHPHGVKYDKNNEGSYYQPNPGLGAAVAPGAKFTYVWQIDESAGPLPSEPSSKAWLYHSHVSGDEEVNMGLIGFIIVTDPKRARADGTPKEVDREFGSLFMIFNESGVDDAAAEAEEHLPPTNGVAAGKTWAQVQELNEWGERYAINGRIFGNLSGLEMNEGERVRWYLFGLGSEKDFHTAHWHGLRAVENGRTTDVIDLMPATMKVVDMHADNPGSWLFHCHVAEHMMEGMFARVTVYPKGTEAVRRAAGPALLGMVPEKTPLVISSAEAVVDLSANAAQPCQVKIEGDVNVPELFPLYNNPVHLQFGNRSITFKPGKNGGDQNSNGGFRATNIGAGPDNEGIISGGRMKFVITFSGRMWGDELAAAAPNADWKQTNKISLPLNFETGGASYRAIVHLTAGRK